MSPKNNKPRGSGLTEAQAIIIGSIIGGLFLIAGVLISNNYQQDEYRPTATLSHSPTIQETFVATIVPSSEVTLPTVAPIDQTDPRTPAFTPTPTRTLSSTSTQTFNPTELMSTTATPQVIVNVASANLRSGPGTNYSVSRTALRDEIFVIVARTQNSDWYLIEVPNVGRLWISSTVVSVTVSEVDVEIARTIPATRRNPPTPTSTIESMNSVPVFEPRGNEVPPPNTERTVNPGPGVVPTASVATPNTGTGSMPADISRYCTEALQGAPFSSDTCSVAPGTHGDSDGNGLVQVGWNEVCAYLYGDSYRYARQDGSGNWACYSS